MRPLHWLDAQPDARAAYIARIPLAARLGIRLGEVGPGRAVMTLPWRPELAGAPGDGAHRGVLAALLDNLCGAALMCALEQARGFSTLSLRMEYPAPAPAGADLRAVGHCRHFDGETAHLDAQAWADDVLVARAAATFILIPGRVALHGQDIGQEIGREIGHD